LDPYSLRRYIESNAIAYGVGSASHVEIDEHNILNATYLAMHRALDSMFADSKHDLHVDRLVVDGDRFKPYHKSVPFTCVRGGDNRYVHVAAASILAKENHDDWIETHFADDVRYKLTSNKGYGTKAHRDGIREYGLTDYHRKTFCSRRWSD
jgi:ribonuclease HII